MAGKDSLFSRCKPSKTTPKKIPSFLTLPGEVRNDIYRHYFEEDFRCELAAKGTKLPCVCCGPSNKIALSETASNHCRVPKNGLPQRDRVCLRLDAPKTVRMSRRIGQYMHVHGVSTKWCTSLSALILVCKQTHGETLALLYNNTTFVFDAPRWICNFLNVISTQSLTYITKLDIHYASYGHPSFKLDQVWKDKHEIKWMQTCKAMAKTLVALETLHLSIHITDSPLFFDLRQTWLRPLLQFRRLADRNRVNGSDSACLRNAPQQLTPLKRVEVSFTTRWSFSKWAGNGWLQIASDRLHSLFGDSIGLAILGATETEAMAGFKEAWEGEYAQWNHHLGFSVTGW